MYVIKWYLIYEDLLFNFFHQNKNTQVFFIEYIFNMFEACINY